MRCWSFVVRLSVCQLLTVIGGHWCRWLMWWGFCCWCSVPRRLLPSTDDSKNDTTRRRTTRATAVVDDDTWSTSGRVDMSDTVARDLGPRRPSTTTYIWCSPKQLTDSAVASTLSYPVGIRPSPQFSCGIRSGNFTSSTLIPHSPPPLSTPSRVWGLCVAISDIPPADFRWGER